MNRRSNLLTSLATGAVLLTACSDDVNNSRPWEFGEDTGASLDVEVSAPDTEPDVRPEVDTGLDRSDAGDTSDAADTSDTADAGDGCVGPARWEINYVDQADRAPGSPVISGDSIYFWMPFEPGKQPIQKVGPGGRVETINVGEGPDRIVAGAQGSLLLGAPRNSGPDIPHAYILDAREMLTKVSFERPLQRSYGAPSGGTGHVFDGERIAMVLENDPNQSPGWAGYRGGDGGVESVHMKDWTQAPAALTDKGFAVLARTGALSGGGNMEVKHYDESTGKLRSLTSTDADERGLASDGSRLWWADDRGVMTWDVTTGTKRRVHRGTCADIDARDGRAAFLCKGENGRELSGPAPILGGELYLWERGQKYQVSLDGALAYHPRLGTKGLAWATYDSPADFGRQDSPGTIYWASFANRRAREVDQVGAPCVYCSALWPDLALSVNDGWVAWNYARDDSGEPGPQVSAGYARPIGSCESTR